MLRPRLESGLSVHRWRRALAAFAFALLLAGMPDPASAGNTQACKTEWNKSSASSTCTAALSVWWPQNVQKCRISVWCVRPNGEHQYNQNVHVSLNQVKHLNNCDGRLSWSYC